MNNEYGQTPEFGEPKDSTSVEPQIEIEVTRIEVQPVDNTSSANEATDETDEVMITILTPPVETLQQPAQQSDLLTSVFEMGAELQAVANTATRQINNAVSVTAAEVGDAIAQSTFETSRAIITTTTSIGDAIGETTSQTSKLALKTIESISAMVSDASAQTSRAALELAQWMSETTTQQTYEWIEQTTQRTGQALDFVGNLPFVKPLAGFLKLDWLVGFVDRVDLTKAAESVRKLQQEYPDESPSQISHRIMVEKAVYAGGMGFVSSLLPGEAAALLAVDLAATTALQTEMVYQIAAAYGLDLKDPARKGEVLGIFGLTLGGRQALRAGLGFLRIVPLAGAVIGASTNATMLYSLGYAACRFYETKLRGATFEPTSDVVDVLKAENDAYLERAIAQQAIMDQILVHMIVASHPERSWEEILPNLAALQLSPASLEAIAANIQSPQPLDELLNQLNRDFAIPLLAQCYRISKLDRDRATTEDHVMQAIAEKFNINLDDIAQQVDQTNH